MLTGPSKLHVVNSCLVDESPCSNRFPLYFHCYKGLDQNFRCSYNLADERMPGLMQSWNVYAGQTPIAWYPFHTLVQLSSWQATLSGPEVVPTVSDCCVLWQVFHSAVRPPAAFPAASQYNSA